jgi:lysozyme
MAAATAALLIYAGNASAADVAPEPGGDDGDGGGWPVFSDPFAGITEMITGTNASNGGTLSPAGLDALKAREGFSATPYADHKGRSIGYGHLMSVFESYTSITREKAEELLASDVAWAVDAVNESISAPLTQSQFDALVSLAYNIGAGAFKRSTLVKRINAYDPGAVAEFARWNKASGQVHAGLVARRAAEAEQFGSA